MNEMKASITAFSPETYELEVSQPVTTLKDVVSTEFNEWGDFIAYELLNATKHSKHALSMENAQIIVRFAEYCNAEIVESNWLSQRGSNTLNFKFRFPDKKNYDRYIRTCHNWVIECFPSNS